MTDEAQQSPAETVSNAPAAWIGFAANGNIQFWTADRDRAAAEKERGRDLRMFTLPELIALAAKGSSASEPISLIDERLVDLRKANDVFSEMDCDRSRDIQRNDREIRWLIDLRSVVSGASAASSKPLTTSHRPEDSHGN